MKKLYFDYCAATPIIPEVCEILTETTKSIFANPSSFHDLGFEANNLVGMSREKISDLLEIQPEEVIFTSGATESNNMAIFGVVRIAQEKAMSPIHIITSQIEHPSVFNCFKQLEKEGVEVTYVPVNSDGIVNVIDIENSIKDNTVFISIMHVNNETGAIQPVEAIGEMIKNTYSYIVFHVDGVQGFGKVSLKLGNIDLYTISGHKIGGAKGTGALILKSNIKICPIIYGGNQEFGLRSGTLNVPGIVSLAEAIRIAITHKEERQYLLNKMLSDLFIKLSELPNIVFNTPSMPKCAPHILNFSFPEIPSAITIGALAKKGIVTSSQSACASKGEKVSRVLLASSNNGNIASSSIRISIHEDNTHSDIEYLCNTIIEISNYASSRSSMITLL